MKTSYQIKLVVCMCVYVCRDGKMFQRASYAGVNFSLVQVKCVPNFTLFCCKSELCRDFALFGVTLKAVNL